MTLTLNRHAVVGDATMGTLLRDGVHECDTLERTAVQIPAGRYRVILTTSDRARKGHLWSPRKDYALPLIDQVPGRSGIRIHAANRPEELDGCIAVGQVSAHLPGEVHESRATLTLLVNAIAKAPGSVRLDIMDAPI